jgi:hypothetical protein
MALVLEMLTAALAGDALAQVVAIAPVTARAMTRLRTMIFIMGSLFVTQSGRFKKIVLDNSSNWMIIVQAPLSTLKSVV